MKRTKRKSQANFKLSDPIIDGIEAVWRDHKCINGSRCFWPAHYIEDLIARDLLKKGALAPQHWDNVNKPKQNAKTRNFTQPRQSQRQA